MFPIGELGFTHVEGYATDLTQLDIHIAHEKLVGGKAHRRTTIATATRLMK